MATKDDPATAAARAALYQQTAKVGRVLNRTFAFYNGSPVGNSFTGNLALGVKSGGVGAALINGVGPPIVQVVPCDEPVITNILIEILIISQQRITVTYENPLPDDIYVLFNSSGQSFPPLSIVPVPPDQVELYYPLPSALPAGVYSLKILRASNPAHCFTVRNNLFVVEAPVACTLEVTGWSGDGVFPNVPLTPGDNDNMVAVTGAGFLSGPLTVTIFAVFGGPNDLNIDSVIVGDDNNLTVQFDADPVQTGGYAIRVELTDDAACFGQYGDMFGQDMLNVDFV